MFGAKKLTPSEKSPYLPWLKVGINEGGNQEDPESAATHSPMPCHSWELTGPHHAHTSARRWDAHLPALCIHGGGHWGASTAQIPSCPTLMERPSDPPGRRCSEPHRRSDSFATWACQKMSEMPKCRSKNRFGTWESLVVVTSMRDS